MVPRRWASGQWRAKSKWQVWLIGWAFRLRLLLPSGNLLDYQTVSVVFAFDSINEQAELGDGEFMSLQKVNLPKMGTAVQAQSITSLVDDKGDKTNRHVASLRTFIPYGEHVFVVTGATPQIDIADVLFNLFASMTDTVSIEFVNSSAYASTSGEEIS